MRQNVSSNIILKIQEIHSFLLKKMSMYLLYLLFEKDVAFIWIILNTQHPNMKSLQLHQY